MPKLTKAEADKRIKAILEPQEVVSKFPRARRTVPGLQSIMDKIKRGGSK